MYISDLADHVSSITGRPDIDINVIANAVLEEIRRSGRYVEDLRIAVGEYGTDADWILDFDDSLGEFTLEYNWDYYNEVTIPVLLEVMTADLGGTGVVVPQVTPESVRLSRGCAPANFYRETWGNRWQGRLTGRPTSIEIVYYSRESFGFGIYEGEDYPWPVDSCLDVVIMGVASRVLMSAGDDSSRDRLYTEYQRLLRQFQLSRIPTNV